MIEFDSRYILRKANQLANSGKFEEAISLLQKVLKSRPEDEKTIEALAILHNNLGVKYANEGKFDEAIKQLEKALEYDPKSENVKRSMAFIYNSKGVELANKGVELANKGKFGEVLNSLENGLHFLEKAYQLDSTDDRIRSNLALAYSGVGIELYGKGEFQQARQFAEKAQSFGIKGELGKIIRENVNIVQTWKPLQEIPKKITTSTLKEFSTIGKIFKALKKQPRKVEDREVTPRYTDVSFPAEVNIDKWEALRVAVIRKEIITPEGEVKIQPKPHDHDVEVEVEIPEPKARGEPPPSMIVNVLVTAPDFEIEGDRFARIVVPIDADSEPAIFKLRAKEIGHKKITIDFIQDGRYLGVVNLEVEIIETYKVAREGEARAESNVEIGSMHDAPDLTLLIQEFSLPGPSTELRYTLTSPQDKLNLFYADFDKKVFSGSVKDWVEEMVKRIEEFSGGEVSSKVVENRLTAIGNNLYDQVMPENLKNFYWDNKDRIKSMVIVSDEPWIPWEIVKPYKSNETIQQEDFFCQYFSFSRWLRGSSPPTGISLTPGKILGVEVAKERRDISVISGKRRKKVDLEGIEREVEFICSLGERGLKVDVIPPKLEEVYNILKSGQFKLFHLCSHGTYNSLSPDRSFVQLLDGSISPEDIVGRRFKEKPFVFLNVCHSARAGYSLTRIGSWASQFSEAGCSGFVGSFWSVDDELAYLFAREFYSMFLDGIPLGEAFRQAREEVRKQNPFNTTWLAYCLYGDPLATIS
ncbi:MAG: hypothetical protein SCARUB_02834 [Candidatus Scalindua rubra]|uniref:CHAT domain-containing protein n=1 Tax=Candidatus Scalindua rubra TaxID=1872076 RepID=A0A1E3X8Z6_9BACT|nr:MAG: hypothetical protein SCARUB_02834 [Candidatus Scalindua rubra]